MKNLINIALKAAIEASREVHKIYEEGFSVSIKKDQSPVTSGDLKSNEIITNYLNQTSIPILSEESEHESEKVISGWEKYWCVDPIDGTKEYVNKTGEYCISIGLLTQETSLLGVLAAPSMKLFYFAAEGLGSYRWNGKYEDLYDLLDEENLTEKILKKSIKLPLKPDLEKYTILTSHSHYSHIDDEYISSLKLQHSDMIVFQMGSAIKIGLVAEGRANEYARLSPINFWDIAGGHAIAKYAGLQIVDYKTKTLITYRNFSSLKIPGYIVKNI
jgi:3'(2'), 5'-bisphosphate nucleotidase